MANKLRLTRDQLASFLTDHEQIRQFELLFSTVDTIAPDVVNEVSIAAGIADNKADQALAQIEIVQQEAQTNASVAENKASQALDAISRLTDAIELVALAPPPREFKRTRYGQFYDTTTQVAAAINTPQAITYNTTDISNGVYLGSPTSRIYVDSEGLYNFQFSIQVDTTSGGTDVLWIWPRKNGTDIPNSASQIQIQGNNAELFSAANFFIDLAAGDYVEFMFAVDDVAATLAAFAATAVHPGVPSIIVTVSDNIRSYS